MRTMTTATVATLLLGAALCTNAGCIVVSVPPKMEVRAGDIPRARVERADCTTRYTPYARELDRVLRQQVDVEQVLQERDWDELADELGDWRGDIRRLSGVADTSHDARLMRQCCDELSGHVTVMLRAGRNHDAAGVYAGIDSAAPALERLTREFPLVEAHTGRGEPEIMHPVEQ